MVHRPSDPRLLLNLISHEKNYSKHLQSLLDSSHASLTSLSAFAATSAQPLSTVILSVVDDFSNADDALCRFKDAIDAWREQLKSLKNLETEITDIARDREILVTRVLKASKHEKPPKDKERSSALSKRMSISQHPRFASESSLSLSIAHSSCSPSSLQTSIKLDNAQAELRACETHLTAKEAELEVARVIAIRDGLRIRCDALVDCGQAWVDMGQRGIRTLADLQIDGRDTQNLRQTQSPSPAPHTNSHPDSPPSTPPSHHSRNNSSPDTGHQVSEISTIGPSQSASQVNVYVDPKPIDDPFIIPNAPNPILGANGSDVQWNRVAAFPDPLIVRPNSTPPMTAAPSIVNPFPRTHSMINVTYVNERAPPLELDGNDFPVPAAHAIQDGLVPTLTPSSKPKAVHTDSGYLTPVSNDDVEDGRREEKQTVQRRIGESPQPERHVISPTLGERREAVNVGGDTSRVAYDADDVRPTPRADDVHHSTPPPPRNTAPAPVEEPRTPAQHRKQSASSSQQKSGFFSNLKRVFSTGGHRQNNGERAREREDNALEREERRMEKEDRRNERKEQKMEKSRLREERREERQREMEERKERDREKREKLREERRRKTDREARMPSADSSSDDEGSIEAHEPVKRPVRVKLIGRGKKDQKARSDDDNFQDVQRESEEVERGQSSGGGYIVKQNEDLQKNLRGGIISSGHVAPFDVFTGGAKVSSSSGRRTTAGGVGDQRPSERGTGSNFVFERGAKLSGRPSAPHPTATSGSRPQGMPSAVASPSTKPFPASPIRPSGAASTLRSDTKFWENISTRSGSPVQIPSTINERSESGGTTAVVGLGLGGVEPGLPKQRQIAVSQPHRGDGVRGPDREATAPAAMGTPRHRMMNGHTRRAVSVDHSRSVSVSSLPAQIRMPTPTASQNAVLPAAEPGESLMSIVDSLARSNRRARDMGLMEVSKSRENLRHGMGYQPGFVASGSGRMTKGKATDVAVTNGYENASSGRHNMTGHGVAPAGKDEVVSAKTLSLLPAESSGSGSPHPASPQPATIAKGVRESNRNSTREEGEDDSTSTASYETVHEDFESADEGMQKPPATTTPPPPPTSAAQKMEETDRRAFSPPPAIRFRTSDRADSASPASRGESTPSSTPQRRKSVRVSLKPTFSPTPPAIEDEADQYNRAPFVFKEQVVAPPSVLGHGAKNQSRPHAPSRSPNANGVQSKGVWDDDSDDNSGYEEAKRLFMMSARSQQEMMW